MWKLPALRVTIRSTERKGSMSVLLKSTDGDIHIATRLRDEPGVT